MKTIKQMLRQPLKTVSGVILMTLAVAVLCVCIGQALAVRTTTEDLARQFTTVAIPKGYDNEGGNLVPKVDAQMLGWLEKAAQENPSVIKKIARSGILSAYIPELTPLNITMEKYVGDATSGDIEFRFYQPSPYNRPYSCAMLVITLDEIGEPKEEMFSLPVENLGIKDFFSAEAWAQWYTTAEKKTAIEGYTIELTGTVTDVVSLQSGYRDPVGRIARLTMTAPTLKELEALRLMPGEQYIVYGMDYADEFWKLIGTLNHDGQYDFAGLEPFDPAKLEIATEEDLEKYKVYYKLSGNPLWLTVRGYYKGIALNEYEIWQMNAISMTLDMPVATTEYEPLRSPDGKLRTLLPKEEITYTDLNGETVTVSLAKYKQQYQIPTIDKLEGTVENFLQSEEGALWQSALKRDAVNNHAFAVIGVDDLDYLTDFSLRKTKIVKGREFTVEEISNGARVCIIHEELALANGLQVGDTITPSFYAYDPGLPYQAVEKTGEALNPSASFYFDTTPFTETQTYTIVGICRGENTWPDVAENAYAFSANTIYIPSSAVRTPMETRNGLPFVSIILKNGQIQQFHELAMRAGYAGFFQYNDQGFAKIAENFHNYEELAVQVLLAGVVVYTILLVLFLLLYPGAQRKIVKTMETLGTSRSRRFGSVLLSSLIIIMPASAAGCLLGVQLWGTVVKQLQEFAAATLALQLESEALWMIAGVQLFMVVLLSISVAGLVTTPGRMSDGR